MDSYLWNWLGVKGVCTVIDAFFFDLLKLLGIEWILFVEILLFEILPSILQISSSSSE